MQLTKIEHFSLHQLQLPFNTVTFCCACHDRCFLQRHMQLKYRNNKVRPLTASCSHELKLYFSAVEGKDSNLKNSDSCSIQKSSKYKPRSHHPSHVCWPTNDIPRVHVLVGPRINGGPQRRHVSPRDGLWFSLNNILISE